MLSREIRQFIAVVESKSINSASQRLNVSQPSVSKTLQNLEHELGVQLFKRSIRGVNLTPEGEILYGHALRLSEEEGQALTEIKKLKEIKNRNQITIGAGHAWSTVLLPKILVEYQNNNHNIFVKVRYGSVTTLWNELVEDKITLILGAEPNYQKLEKSIHYRGLLPLSQIVYAHKSHPIFKSKKPVIDITKYQWISWGNETYDNNGVKEFCNRNQIPNPIYALETSSIYLGIELAVKGEYIIRLPSMMKNILQCHEIYPIKVEPLISYTTGVLFKESTLGNKSTAHLYENIVAFAEQLRDSDL
jgi:DNA-binding transcriptional LysR family regulator